MYFIFLVHIINQYIACKNNIGYIHFENPADTEGVSQNKLTIFRVGGGAKRPSYLFSYLISSKVGIS